MRSLMLEAWGLTSMPISEIPILTPKSDWRPQLESGGNNIPESYRRKFTLGSGYRDEGDPEDFELLRFIKDQL